MGPIFVPHKSRYGLPFVCETKNLLKYLKFSRPYSYLITIHLIIIFSTKAAAIKSIDRKELQNITGKVLETVVEIALGDFRNDVCCTTILKIILYILFFPKLLSQERFKIIKNDYSSSGSSINIISFPTEFIRPNIGHESPTPSDDSTFSYEGRGNNDFLIFF